MNRGERRWRTEKVIKRRLKDIVKTSSEDFRIPITNKVKGLCKKKHPFDCGRTCYMCHCDKLLNIRNKRKLLSDEDFKDQLNDAPW